jgi:hypothetical protein
MKVPLSKIAHTRSGDKGDTCNIGVIAYHERDYPALLREVTAQRVKRHFGEFVKGEVERFELPNLGALNFLLHGALGGGGTTPRARLLEPRCWRSKSTFPRSPSGSPWRLRRSGPLTTA